MDRWLYNTVIKRLQKPGPGTCMYYNIGFGIFLIVIYAFMTKGWSIHVEYAADYAKEVSQSAVTFSSMQIHTVATSESRDYLYGKMPLAGRLGNELFLYATLFALGTRFNKTIVYNYNSILFKAFNISATPIRYEKQAIGWKHKREKQANTFDGTVVRFVQENQANLQLIGYFQSFRYFDQYQSAFKKELRLREASVQEEVDSFLRRGALDSFGYSYDYSKVFFIGVHIRRGDMTTNYSHRRGYTEASAQYLANAIRYFQELLIKDRILFLVVSDDMSWSKSNFRPEGSHVAFSEFASKPAHDMSILASCNHTLMTVGSFGWWGAFLAGGYTVYYKDFPLAGTYISKLFNKRDYFPTDWVGLR